MLPIFLPCAAGVESLLADEVTRLLPGVFIREQRGGVSLSGGPLEVMTLNLESRLAQRVLIEVAEGPYEHEDDIYALGAGVDWTQWITPRETLRVDTSAQRSPLRSLNFVALRIKDAVCDVLRDATGDRPSVDTRHPDLPLLLHLGPERASVYVDSSGEPLFKRGWREDKGDAPLKETLAAAMIAASGWNPHGDAPLPLYDPCCGSGTIAIEAAQIACRIPAGAHRRFAFEKLLPFQAHVWRSLLDEAEAAVCEAPVKIYGSDVSHRMVDFAGRNAERAGVTDAIEFRGGDALQRMPPAEPATMSKRNRRHSMGPFHMGTRRDSFRRMRPGSLKSGVSSQALQPAKLRFQWVASCGKKSPPSSVWAVSRLSRVSRAMSAAR
jgi:putative N6-adenine-specific DNA methylase